MKTAALLCLPALALAQAFTFEIGAPVASGDFATKTASFVFRTTGCVEPAKPEVTATAEGVVDGARRSVPLRVIPSSRPGVYAVFKEWGAGQWAVVLNGSCGDARAGAIVPVGRGGFIRDASKFFTHPTTPAGVQAALKAFPAGGYK